MDCMVHYVKYITLMCELQLDVYDCDEQLVSNMYM